MASKIIYGTFGLGMLALLAMTWSSLGVAKSTIVKEKFVRQGSRAWFVAPIYVGGRGGK
jgi:hypothetical protein